MIEIWLFLLFDYMLKNALTIAALVVGIGVPLSGFLYWRRRRLKKHFKLIWKKSSSLKPRDLLELRPFHPYYHKRSEDESIHRCLRAKKNVLVKGLPLGGKTRAVYEAVTSLNKPCDILIARSQNIDLERFLFPRHLKFWRPKVLIIDDLHRFVEQQNFEHLFRVAEENGTTIVATCRSGFECDKAKGEFARRGLGFEMIFAENVFELGKVSQDVAEKVAGQAGRDWEKVRFDGTIGSVFMKLEEMETRFKSCSPPEKTLLRVLRKLYISGVYEENQVFPLKWVKAVAKTDELEGTGPQWTDWTEKLEAKEFVTRQKEAVQAEEVYLQDIIKPEAEVSELELILPMLTALAGLPDALFKLGTRACGVSEIGTRKAACMKVAVCAYRLALEVYTIDDFSLQHAIIQYNLGTVYVKLAEIDDKRMNSKNAVGAYERALRVYTIERFPKDYAESQSNLGAAYRALAEVEEPAVNAKKAIRACKEALKARSRDHFLTDRSGPYNNLANAYIILAGVENRAANAKKAIQVCEEALNVRNGNNVPRNYAKTQNNLGNAYRTLAEVEAKAENCRLAIGAFQEALKVDTLDRFPMQYGMTQNNLGIAYSTLAEVEDVETKAENCRLAIEAFQEALKVYTLDRFPMQYGTTQHNLGTAYRTLAEVEAKAKNCKLAIGAFQEALKVHTPDRFPMQYGATQNNLGNAYATLAEVQSKAENCSLAIGAYEEALKVRTLDRFPMQYGNTQNNLGTAYRTLAEEDEKAINCGKAEEAFSEALKVFAKDELPQDHQMVQDNLRNLREFCQGE